VEGRADRSVIRISVSAPPGPKNAKRPLGVRFSVDETAQMFVSRIMERAKKSAESPSSWTQSALASEPLVGVDLQPFAPRISSLIA